MDYKEILKTIFFYMNPELLTPKENEWLSQTTQLDDTMLYANGRFQGLLPGLPDYQGYGGHPGLIFKLMMTAITFGITNIGISVSTKMGDEKNPLSFDQKRNKILQIISEFKHRIPNIIMQQAMHY